MNTEDRVNILLVDDQPSKLLSYEAVLGELGENLVRAGSGREALEHLLKGEIAVMLVDVCMPDLDGFQLAAMIREHPRFKNTAIVFVSAVQLDSVDHLRGYQLGAVDYVPVPVVPELLRAKVKVFVELYRKERELERLNRELERRVADRTEQLERANAHLRLAIQVARLETWDWTLATDEVRQSGDGTALPGQDPAVVGTSLREWLQRFHPEDRAATEDAMLRAKSSGSELSHVLRSIRSDGSILWWEARARCERDAQGRPTRMNGVLMNITEHKAAEDRQRVMVLELHHRVKNSLAMVQAIASLTGRTAPDVRTFSRAFNSRLISLSRTHTMLADQSLQRIGVRDLLSGELGAFADGDDERISMQGPPLDLPSQFALSLGLAVHELTTNAVKYGALSVPQGRLSVSWAKIDTSPGRSNFLFHWRERDGPAVRKLKRAGFGTTLLNRLFDEGSGARMKLLFEQQGVDFELMAPLT